MATYYIDPSASTNGTGTLASPFNTWASVTWTQGNEYLQKSGTTFTGTVSIGATGVIVGSYGDTEASITTARQLTGPWTAQANGEYSQAMPAGVTTGNSTTAYMLLIENEPVPKAGTVGSLAAGYWQTAASQTAVYYKPINGQLPTERFFLGTDSVLTHNPASVVPDDLILSGLEIWGGNNGIHLRINGTTKPERIKVLDCVGRHNAKSGLIVEGGDQITVRGGNYRYNQATTIKFGTTDTSANNAVTNLTFKGVTLEWNNSVDSDTNTEGHLIDLGAQGGYAWFTENRISRNGYASGKSYRFTNDPSWMVSFDGCSDVVVARNSFEDNYLGCISFGCDTQNSGRSSNRCVVTGNLFTRTGAAIATDGILQNVIQFESRTAGTYDASNCVIAGNTFYSNYGSEAFGGQYRPACIYVTTSTTHNHVLPVIASNVFVGNTNDADIVVNFVGSGVPTLDITHNMSDRAASFAVVRLGSGDTLKTYATASALNAEIYASDNLSDSAKLGASNRPLLDSNVLGVGRHFGYGAAYRDLDGKQRPNPPSIGAYDVANVTTRPRTVG